MPADRTFVIVGARLAGAKAAGALREEGFGGQHPDIALEDLAVVEHGAA